MHILKRIKYPKFILLILTFILAYFIFQSQDTTIIKNLLSSLGYFGTFLAGILFAYGFTTAPSVAILLILAKTQNLWVASFIAAFGALVGSTLLFLFIRRSLSDEIKKLDGKIKHQKWIHSFLKVIPHKIRKHLILILVGLILAIPIPDEFAISLLAFAKEISLKTFLIISFIFSFLGIFAILYIGRLI